MSPKLKWKLESQRQRIRRRIALINREQRTIRKQIKSIDILLGKPITT